MPHPDAPDSEQVQYVDSTELAKIDTYFWGELCFYTTILDEFTGKGMREIPQFVDEIRAGMAQHGVEAVLQESPQGLTIEVRTQSPSIESRDMVVQVLETLQRRYLCTIRDFRVPENIGDIWGEDFGIGFAAESDASTAAGRRQFLQYALNEQYRLTQQIEKHLQVIVKIDETVQRYEGNPKYRDQIIIHRLTQKDLIQQIDEMEKQLSHLKEIIAAGMEVNGVVTATRQQAHGVVRPQFPLPVAGMRQEIEWHGLDEPEHVRPPMCSTVADILYHPVLRSALSRVVPDSGDGYEVDLIRVLSDAKKLDELLVQAKNMLKRIDKNKGVNEAQIERGVRGIFSLVAFVKQFPDELFFDELKGEKLKDVDFAADIPPSMELVNLIHGVRSGLDKKAIFNSKKTLSPEMADIANAEKIQKVGIGSIKIAIMKDGKKVYFVEGPDGVAMPAYFSGKKIVDVDKVSSPLTTKGKLHWFCVTFEDGSVRYLTSKMVPAMVGGSEAIDHYAFDARTDFLSSATYVCFKNQAGHWYDYFPDDNTFKPVPDLFIARPGGSTQSCSVKPFMGKFTLVSLKRKKTLVFEFNDDMFPGKNSWDRPDSVSVRVDSDGYFRIGNLRTYNADLKSVG